jgi:hypothetical protein
MKLSNLWRRRHCIIVVRPAQMTEKEVDAAIGGVAETHPTYRAFMQLIDQAEEEAREAADKDSYLPRSLEIHTGGAKYVRALRLHVLMIRERFEKRQR